jgi:hypothetical protein
MVFSFETGAGAYLQHDEPWLDIALREWGYEIAAQASGSCDNRELTRIYLIEKPGEK